MSAPAIIIEIESPWCAYVRGARAWELCRKAGRRKPAWSSVARAWVVSERTARDVTALAEHAGLDVVVTASVEMAPGQDLDARTGAECADSAASEGGLW